VVLVNRTGDYVLTGIHHVDPETGLRGPNLLPDPLLPGRSASIPAGGGLILAYDEDGDCYSPGPADSPGDTVRVAMDDLTSGNIHAGEGSVPVRLINGLQARVRRVTDRESPLEGHDYLGTAMLWPAETLTVWSDSGRTAFWVVDQAGAVLVPPPVTVGRSPVALVVDSLDIFAGYSPLTAGSGPARLRIVNLLADMDLAALRLRALPDSADSAGPAGSEIRFGAPPDTMRAAVLSADRGRYLLEVVLTDSTVLRTPSFPLRRDTSRIFLRPDILSAP
jgi:hypothetical protein